MLNLLRLGTINGDINLLEKANQLSKVFSRQVKGIPSAHTFLMTALDYKIGPSYLVVIAGDKDRSDTTEMLNALTSRFIPNRVVIINSASKEDNELYKISETIRNQKPLDGKATAYVCFKYSCKDPTVEIKRMLELMSEN